MRLPAAFGFEESDRLRDYLGEFAVLIGGVCVLIVLVYVLG